MINRYEEAIKISAQRYGQKNGVIRSHRQDLLNGKQIAESIADFEVLANELRYFHSVLIHYNVNLEYFSGEAVPDSLDRCLSKRLCMEFTIFIHVKGYFDDTAEYLPRLLKRVGKKLFFGRPI